MSEQFSLVRFSRGVKLTVAHEYAPLQDIAAVASDSGVTGMEESLGQSQVTWAINNATAGGVETGGIVFTLPFTCPPFQEMFNRSTLAPPEYQVVLQELSLSFDQRAEPYGIDMTTQYPVDVDMNRYNMTLKLLERQPSLLSTSGAFPLGNVMAATEVFTVDIDGVVAFGTGADGVNVVRNNPVLLSDLNIPVKPYAVYVWVLTCPGLYDATPGANQLATPSLTLSATFLSPLTLRDFTSFLPAPGIQNMPTVHNGAHNGTTIPVTPPAADTIITGADIQDANHEFDRTLRQGAGSGYGTSFGALGNTIMTANRLPAELMLYDSHYHMIAVPMWGGQFRDSVRGGDIPTAGLPWLTAPNYSEVTMDRRVFPVPEGFVLHHAFAVWNLYSPKSTAIWNNLWRDDPSTTIPTDITYTQDVSISLTTGLRSDDYKEQLVGRLVFNPIGGVYPFTDLMLDAYFPQTATGTKTGGYVMMQIPLVSDNVPSIPYSWFDNGRPFFMGRGNNITQDRTDCGDAPTAFGGAAFGTPVTNGAENMLEIRWAKTALDLSMPGDEKSTVIGQGGEWVILCGMQTLGG